MEMSPAIISAKQLTDSIRNADLEGLIEALEARPNLLNFQPGLTLLTPLMRIIVKINMANDPDDYYVMIDELINRGANLNLKDKNGDTALHLAVVMGDTILIETLLESGADRTILNNNGQSPLDLALESENYETIDLFFSHPPGNEPPREPERPPPGRPPGGNVGGRRTRRRRGKAAKQTRKVNRLKSRRNK